MITRKKCIGKRQLYRRAAHQTITYFRELDNVVNDDDNGQSLITQALPETPENTISEIPLFLENSHICKENNSAETESSILNICKTCDIPSSDNVDDIHSRNDVIPFNARNSLIQWIFKHRPTQAAVNDLLRILHPLNLELPLDSRTLLKTPCHIYEKKIENC